MLQSPCFEQFGWNMKDGQVCIAWDNGHSPESEDDESKEELDHEAEDEAHEVRIWSCIDIHARYM